MRCAAILIVLAGCTEMDATVEDNRTESEGGEGVAVTRQFDPSAVAVGDSVLGLRIVSMDVQPSLVDTAGWTGFVRFDGRITLSGTYRPHFDYPELSEVCFFPDDISAKRLPVFPNDRRYAWLCFTNQPQAREELGSPPAEGRATVRVDEYHYHYAHSDVYNTAALVDVITPVDSLAGMEWVLTALQGDRILAGSRITLTVTESGVTGYSGCNWYGGRLTEAEDSIRVEDASQTARLCMHPAGVMEQENLFGRLLAAVRSYRVAGDSLQLRDAAGEKVLEFRARTARAMNPDELLRSEWELETLPGLPLDGRARITLAFEQEGIHGFAGCRNYTGTYVARGDAIRLHSLTMAELECTDEEMNELEGTYTTALSEATHYWLRGDRLDVFTVGGDTLSFVKTSIDG